VKIWRMTWGELVRRLRKTTSYPIVFEREDSGAVSAYVPGLPLYAAADTPARAERAIRRLLAAYLDDRASHRKPLAAPRTTIRVARVTTGQPPVVRIVGIAALLGHARSAAKAAAARRNGARGGRPRSK
jgi:predicted RNase H-like HicB family nuclease